MGRLIGTDYYGKKGIAAEYDTCSGCLKPQLLSSYTSDKSFHLFGLPIIPLGRCHIARQCPACGHSVPSTGRAFKRKRKKAFSAMMKAFSVDAENPEVTLQGLQTLEEYHQETWFQKVVDTYGKRFENNAAIQLQIAEGMLRFQQYDAAETYCLKAIALDNSEAGTQLLERIRPMQTAAESSPLTTPQLRPESLLAPYAFFSLLCTATLIGIGFMGYLATRNHSAWLVSGSPVVYRVEIDAKEYELKPYERKPITLRLGRHHMRAHGLIRHTQPVRFKYTLSLFEQKRGNHALVLNPDAMAILYTETEQSEPAQRHYRFGETVYKIDQVSQVFSELLPNWKAGSPPTRLQHIEPESAMQMVELLQTQVSSNAAGDYAVRILEESPTTQGIEKLLAAAVDPLSTEAGIAYLQKGLDPLPAVLAWHIFYQDYRRRKTPAHDLENEYALRCEAAPDQPELYYLLARVARNRQNARLLYEKAEQGRGVGGTGYYAVARNLLCAGRFPEARIHADQALKKDPQNPDFIDLDNRIKLALRQYQTLLENLKLLHKLNPDDNRNMEQQIKYLTLLGQHDAVEELIGKYAGTHPTAGSLFNAARFYTVGNIADYLENLAQAGTADALWQTALYRGNLPDAVRQLKKMPRPQLKDYLLLYCSAQVQHNPAIASTALAHALHTADHATAELLSAPRPPAQEDLLRLEAWPPEKALLCTVLGFRFPQHHTTYFRLAKRFNHTPDHPQLLIKNWIQSGKRK